MCHSIASKAQINCCHIDLMWTHVCIKHKSIFRETIWNQMRILQYTKHMNNFWYFSILFFAFHWWYFHRLIDDIFTNWLPLMKESYCFANRNLHQLNHTMLMKHMPTYGAQNICRLRCSKKRQHFFCYEHSKKYYLRETICTDCFSKPIKI